MMKTQNPFPFRLTDSSRLWMALLAGLPIGAYAQNVPQTDANDVIVLKEVYAKGEKNAGKNYDVTKLGEIKKTAQTLQQDQVEGIRDSVRYDPGISVNESGGRGGSRGFAIRGVDKERVAVSVDGLESSVMLRRRDRNGTTSAAKSSGAQNEIEYENLQELDIRKGSSSLASGSGALGGSLSASTKTTEDFLDAGQAFGGRFKTGYTSKDRRKMVSLGVAGRIGDFDGFLQYTYRQGHEIRAHEDLYKRKTLIDPYEPNGGAPGYLSANDVSGPLRQVPNPMDYQSGSLLSKFGYHFSPEYYIGAVIEDTKQNYDVREMFIPNYWEANKEDRIFTITPFTGMTNYTPTRYYLDEHQNRRIGLEYRYQNQSDIQPWKPDSAVLRFDTRKLEISSDKLDLNCSLWPTASHDCRPTEGGQIRNSHKTTLSEKDKRFDFTLDKQWNFNDTEYAARLRGGYTDAAYRLKEDVSYLTLYRNMKNGELEATINTHEVKDSGVIKGKKYFLALENQLRLNDKLSFSGGIRFDHQVYSANPNAEQKTRGILLRRNAYNNWSWDAGVKYQPFTNFSVTYRNSSGFRVPSIVEQLGADFNIDAVFKQTDNLKPETSINNEIGFAWESPMLDVTGSYFQTDYKNLIGLASRPNPNGIGNGDEIYYNLHKVKVRGFDFGAKMNVHEAWDKIPEGVQLFANISQTKASQPQKPKEYSVVSSYTLDAIQPMRVVYGVAYEHPDDKWGLKLTTTYSKSKNLDELMGYSQQGGLSTYTSKYDLRTKSWRTADLTGFYRINKDMVIRAGIYNIFNYRYLTWDSARQTGYGLDAKISSKNYRALAAPGRNYLVTFEMRF